MDNNIKDKIEDLKEWVSEHTKIVMPAVLLVCVLITVIVAVNANKKAAEEVEAQVAETTAVTEEPTEEAAEETPMVALEENAYPAVNTLMANYYDALANGDIDTILSMNECMDDMEKMRIQEMSKYIEAYPELEVYTKKCLNEGTYLVYVYSKVKFTEYDKLVPGMQAFYVCTDENGNCYINEGEDDTAVADYIREISLQDDAVDLNNRINVEYNEMLESDEELNAFLADLDNRIDIAVGEALAKAEAEATPAQEPAEAAAAEGAAEGTEAEGEQPAEGQEAAQEEQSNEGKTVRATDVVNVRSSDSETADKVGKAQIGDEFTLLEEKGNGWSKITYEGEEAFIKSEFLEVIEQEAEEETPEEEEEEQEEETQTATTSNGDADKVTVKESVNVRKSANEDGEKLGVVYEGEELELLMKQADGWTKVKYKGQTAYVKSEFVE